MKRKWIKKEKEKKESHAPGPPLLIFGPLHSPTARPPWRILRWPAGPSRHLLPPPSSFNRTRFRRLRSAVISSDRPPARTQSLGYKVAHLSFLLRARIRLQPHHRAHNQLAIAAAPGIPPSDCHLHRPDIERPYSVLVPFVIVEPGVEQYRPEFAAAQPNSRARGYSPGSRSAYDRLPRTRPLPWPTYAGKTSVSPLPSFFPSRCV
jgi:hypothetical protein